MSKKLADASRESIQEIQQSVMESFGPMSSYDHKTGEWILAGKHPKKTRDAHRQHCTSLEARKGNR